jgi:hypothetical protein
MPGELGGDRISSEHFTRSSVSLVLAPVKVALTTFPRALREATIHYGIRDTVGGAEHQENEGDVGDALAESRDRLAGYQEPRFSTLKDLQ